MPSGDVVAKGDTVRGSFWGVEAEVIEVRDDDELIVRRVGEVAERRWFNDVTLVKRATDPPARARLCEGVADEMEDAHA